MYILSDKFLGNINNNKYSYLKGNNFFYTNDGINYTEIEIDNKHIFNGNLNKFYTYANIHHWISEDMLMTIENIIDKKTNRLYLEIHIDNNNNILNKYIIQKKVVDFNKCVEPYEVVTPVKKEPVKVFAMNEGYMMSSDEDIFDEFKLCYISNICFPDMIYREDIKQYVFKNNTLFEYKSKMLQK